MEDVELHRLHSPNNQEECDEGGRFTVEDGITSLGFGTFQALLFAYAGMAWIAEAMEMMLLSFIGPAVSKYWNLSSTKEGLITSVVFVGMMVGAYSWGVLSDLKGRRSGFFLTSVLTFCAGILSAFAPNYYMLLVLRCLVGVGLAGGPVISSWFLEFVPTATRGLWMVTISIFWTVGTVSEAALAWAVMPNMGWRWLLGFSSIPLLVLLVFYPLVPESPRYLAAKGDLPRALKILQSMSRLNKRALPLGSLVTHSKKQPEVGSENGGDLLLKTKEETCVFIEKDSALQKGTMEHGVLSLFLALFSPSMLKTTVLLWLVFFANAFVYYGLVLLTSQLSSGTDYCKKNSEAVVSSGTTKQMYIDIFITSLAELPGLALAALVVDRFGRKNSMAGLLLLCGAFMIPLTLQLSERTITFLLFSSRACIMGSFTIVFIYAPEVYPTELRTSGLGTANSFARIGGMICPLVAIDLIKNCHQPFAISLFSVVLVLASIAVLLLPVETKGRALVDGVED